MTFLLSLFVKIGEEVVRLKEFETVKASHKVLEFDIMAVHVA